ncbi:unnamed protein product [Closterium sp. Yama58-4]|nr:unnamed protein product [Closterium sp. Yama58-4]
MAIKGSPGRSPNSIAVGWVLLAVFLSSAALAESKTIIVGYGIFSPWRYGVSGWKPFRTVQPGDQLMFKWLGEHDVWRFPTKIAYDNCDFTLATQLHPKTGIFGAHYFYPVKDIHKGTTLYFGCAVGNHCARKMKAKVVVS